MKRPVLNAVVIKVELCLRCSSFAAGEEQVLIHYSHEKNPGL